MDGCPLGLGLVVEDKPTEFSCMALTSYTTITTIIITSYYAICMPQIFHFC